MNDDTELPEKLALQLRHLPSAIPPERDLWPEIRDRLEVPDLRPSRSVPLRGFWRYSLLAAAAAGVVGLSLVWRSFRGSDTATGWAVAVVSGSPQLDRQRLADQGTWRRGQWLETDSDSRARLAVGTIGEVNLEPNSRLRLLGTAAQDHRLRLERGTLRAFIWAPPRLFFVETPSATAVDLGCAYTLSVDDAGGGTLHVTSGYVALESGARRALIPAGLLCLTRPGKGPGTPFSQDAAPELRAALERFDFTAGGEVALEAVLRLAGSGDVVTLWHLLTRAPAPRRADVFERLARLHAPPAGVTREGILAADRAMLKLWAAELGLFGALSEE
ncbi:MAG: FecR domain-containing protein [Opitutaceae bacterium]|nr:FecR domain-containing protein [Opitutaceae bacterium]